MNRKVIIATLDGDLWLLEFRNAVPMVNQKRDRVVAGDIRNSAGWFINNYIPVGCAPLQFPVERLIFPAAHAVVVGARENPSGISGLEVLVIRRGSAPVFLDRTQEDALKKRSIRLDAVIRKKLFEPFVLTQHA